MKSVESSVAQGFQLCTIKRAVLQRKTVESSCYQNDKNVDCGKGINVLLY